MEKNNVYLVDPPWNFKTYSDKGRGRSADNHYSVMSYNDLLKLNIPSTKNSAMFMWVTCP